VYWDDDVEDASQLRDVSECFGDETRNSEKTEAGLDDRKDPVKGGILDDTNTNFAISEKYDSISGVDPGSVASASERNSERELLAVPNISKNGTEKQIDEQNECQSVSQIQSEVERNACEVDWSASDDSDQANHPANSNWRPHIIIPGCINERGTTYVRMKVLESIPEFAGIDGSSYRLGKDESVLLPEAQAKVLWQRKLAVLDADEMRRSSRRMDRGDANEPR
jgi:hypothetical protein